MDLPVTFASEERELTLPSVSIPTPLHAPRVTLWQDANMRLFLLSECLRMFGAYFSAIALPWLVMQATGSAAAMGISIFLTGVPRAGLVMVFGALCERWSPRALLLASSLLRVGLLALGAALAASGQNNTTALYALCLGFGLADAIFLPARGALTPRLVQPDRIHALNALGASIDQFWGLAGPGLAGLLITLVGRLPLSGGEHGTAAVLLTSALAMLLSVLLLLPVRLPGIQGAEQQSSPAVPLAPHEPGRPLVRSLRALLRFFREERGVRSAFLMVYGISVISASPFAILMPMLAVSRYTDGAGALGLLTSALSAGTLLGALGAGMAPPNSTVRLAAAFTAALVGFATAMLVLFAGAALLAAGVALVLAAALIGYVTISGLSQIQRDTPPALIGWVIGMLHLK